MVGPDSASVAENTFHHGRTLRGAPGSTKLISSPVPASCYELQGLDTGILAFPAVPEVDWAASGTGDGWCIQAFMKLTGAGRLRKTDGTTEDNFQYILSSGPNYVATTTQSLWVSFFNFTTTENYRVGVRWGSATTRADFKTDSGNLWLDPEEWFIFWLEYHGDVGTEKVVARFLQPSVSTTDYCTITRAEDTGGPDIQRWYLGGVPPRTGPMCGLVHSCPMLVSEVRMWDEPEPYLTDSSYARATPTGNLVEVWPLSDSETSDIVGWGGNSAWMVGNRVHRDTPATFGGLDQALRFDGTGIVFVPEGHKLREPPSGDLPGFYLERDELSMGLMFRAPLVNGAYNPFHEQLGAPAQGDRAVLLNWVTPHAALSGRTEATNYATYHAAGSKPRAFARPSEHLRLELRRDSGGEISLLAFWGELDVYSLVHPPGTPGGNTSTSAWPPPVDSTGAPAPPFNAPQGANSSATETVVDWTSTGVSKNARNVQRIILGDEGTSDGGLDNPLQYDWLIIVERKTDHGGADNECRLVAYPFDRTTGLWLSATSFPYPAAYSASATTGYGLDPDVAKAQKLYPNYQSMYCVDFQNIVGVNWRRDNYPLAIGGAIPGFYGDELGSGASGTGPLGVEDQGLIPEQGGGPGFVISDELISEQVHGWIGGFFALKKYLNLREMSLIAGSGGFGLTMRSHFSDDLLMSYLFGEGGGTVLREHKGNDVQYEDKITTKRVADQADEDVPTAIGHFPRPDPPWHDEAEIIPLEYSRITGVVQRNDLYGNEEIFVTARPGLYRYSRSSHTLSRVLTLPGQGGDPRASIVVDDADVIHIAGGPGRPVIITRDGTIAVSGLERPLYDAPDQLITKLTALSGGIRIEFQVQRDAVQDNLAGWEIPDQGQIAIAVGYWSDVLNTRSAPGPSFVVRYTDKYIVPPQQSQTPPISQYRVMLKELPLPFGPNKSLVTHWEIYRTEVNSDRLFLETRLPIGDKPGSSLVGYKQDISLGEQADFLRAPPPEGMRRIALLGERIFGVGLPDNPRSIVWSRLRDSTVFPPIYSYTLTHSSTPAVGVRARRDRAFAVSRDYLYQILDKMSDVDPDGRLQDSVEIVPVTEGAGALDQDAIGDDEENGLYLFGQKTVYLTEGGQFRSISQKNDSVGEAGNTWTWPISWDLSSADEFLAFHDEQRRFIGICGPSAEDPNRRDAMLIFYEHRSFRGDVTVMDPQMSRMKGFGMTAHATVYNPATGNKEIWYGTDLGYLLRFGEGGAVHVDYDWLSVVTPKVGIVLRAPTSTSVLLDGSFSSYPADIFVGAHLQFLRNGTLVSIVRVLSVTVSPSWVEVVVDQAHGAETGDHWIAGAARFEWRSGDVDFGDVLQDKRIMSVSVEHGGS
jgi:hypothetical protein